MGVYHRRTDVFVPEQFLHGPNVIPGFQARGRKGVPQAMTTGWLGDICLANSGVHGPLQDEPVEMVPPERYIAISTRDGRWDICAQENGDVVFVPALRQGMAPESAGLGYAYPPPSRGRGPARVGEGTSLLARPFYAQATV